MSCSNYYPVSSGPAFNLLLPPEGLKVVLELKQPDPLPPSYPTTMDKIKTIAAYLMIIIGMSLLVTSFVMLGGAALELLTIDSKIAETLFLCGLAGALSGFSLNNSGYKGTAQLKIPNLPLDLKFEKTL